MGEEFYVFWTDSPTGERRKLWANRDGHHIVKMNLEEAERRAEEMRRPNLMNVADVLIVPVERSRRARAHLRKVR
jgi:hypothetical protein